MANYNRVILVGNLTRDIELRYTPGGTAVADAGLAVNDRVKKNDEWIEETCFVDMTLWGKNAENAAEYLSKGSPILVEGRLKFDSWENDKGEKRSKLKVNVQSLQFLGNKKDGEDRPQRETVSAGVGASETAKDGDIPF